MKKLIFLLLLLTGYEAWSQYSLSGELKTWHKITIDFEGPEVSETDDYNPFMNYRLNVTFTHKRTGKTYKVPGYFAADGNAGETSASGGNIWRVHFAPDETGKWIFNTDFRKGKWVAVSDKLETGVAGEYMDNTSGEFIVEKSDKQYPDFRARGRLNYIGGHYLRFEGNQEYFLKNGVDAPENLLSYIDFDGDFATDGHKDNLVKSWEPHVKDWNEGDPVWKENKGKGLIGAVNYLASEGLNAMSFLTMNIVGDDQNVFPYINYDTWDRMDVSRLDQWEIVFAHAQKKGIFLHFKTQEHEGQGLLDNGGVGAFRKLYYRELIARFGHHMALNWNLGEEDGDWVKNHKTPPQFKMERLSMAQYFYDHDPYHHHVVIHNGNLFYDLLGPDSKLTGPSIQTNSADFRNVHKTVIKWRELSSRAGKPWACAVDEPGDAQHSLIPDADDPDKKNARINALWGAYTAGAWGIEWYFGYKHDHSDLTCQDFRSRDLFWDQCRNALSFFRINQIPFWEMKPSDELSSNGFCLAKPGESYVLMIPDGGTADLLLTTGEYYVKWFDPVKGGELINGSKKTITGCGWVNLGEAPRNPEKDWVVLVTNVNKQNLSSCGNPIFYSAIDDFPVNSIEGFAPGYKDHGNKARAINAAIFMGKTSAVQDTFNHTSGYYNVCLNTLTELDGESEYKVWIGDTELCKFRNPETDTDYKSFQFLWPEVMIKKGDIIRVEFNSATNGKIPEKDTTAFSRGRWTSLDFFPLCLPPSVSVNENETLYLEKNGVVIIEAENNTRSEVWKTHYDTRQFEFLKGFSGESCIQFIGNTEVNGPATAPLVYKFKIDTPGTYSLKVRGLEAPLETGEGDKANDCFIRVNGQKGWTGEDTKFVLLGDSYTWAETIKGEPGHHDFHLPEYKFKKGTYELVLSGRSKNFFVDRLILFHTDLHNFEDLK